MVIKFHKKNPFIKKIFAFNLAERDAWIKEQAGLVENDSDVLDVGAGSCPYRAYFSHCNYSTQDVAQLRPEQLRHGGYGEIDYVCDAAKIPVPDASFDIVLCTEMLEHHPEPIRVVHELSRVLRPGGKLILTAPLGSGIHQEPFHFYGGYTPYWYEKFLVEAGFSEIMIQANGGFFKHFGQESIRFAQLSNPIKLKANYLVRACWAPIWIFLAPLLGIMMPILCAILDSSDSERRFTVGYHVVASLAKEIK